MLLDGKESLLLLSDWCARCLLIASLFFLLLLLRGLFLGVDEDANLSQHLDELSFSQLKEGITKFGTFACKDSL